MTEEYSPKQNNKILVVDDVASNRMLLRTILSREGYEVDECENGLLCVQYCSEVLPQMILLDIMMPEMDGLEACKLLRSMYSQEELPIIMVTTKSEGEDIKVGLEVGANDYVTKPVDRHILLARVRNQLILSESRLEVKKQKVRFEQALKIQDAMGDVLPDAIAVHNESGGIVYSNVPLMDACGGGVPASIEEIFACIYEDCLQDRWQLSFKEIAMSDSLESNEEITVGGAPVRSFRVSSMPISLDDGSVFRVWLWKEVTHTRELERNLRQQVKIATVSTFTSGVSHNFNNIMGTVLGAADLLDKVVSGNSRGERCVEIIRKAVTSGKVLTDRMTGMTRTLMDNPKASQRQLTFVLNSIFDIQREISGKAIEFTIEGSEEVLPKLSRRNLLVILTNLITNSVDSIQEEGSVTVRFETTEDGNAILSVIDSGVGMDETQVSRVCEPFYSTKNLDERNQVSYEGNGLGMWNVLNIVRLYGARLDIRSEPGKGTKVSVHFPTIAAVEQSQQAQN